MSCGGALTATVLTAGAGMLGGIGGNPLSSVGGLGIPNSITDSVTGLTGSVSMASFTGAQSAFQGLSSSGALTSTLGKIGSLPTGLQSTFTNMASGLGDGVFSAGFDVFSGDALGAMGLPAGLSNWLIRSCERDGRQFEWW